MSRRAGAWTAAALLTLTAAQPAAALGLPGGGGFSVSGKGGPFIKQVSSRKLDQAQAAGEAMGLSSDAVNQGQYQTARLHMPKTEAHIKALLDRIEAHWPYSKAQPIQVIVLGVDQYNAYSLPDGSIVVAFGLLETAQSDDEVAFVLAHELGHLRLGHFAQNAKKADGGGSTTSRMAQLFVVGSAIQSGAAGGGFTPDATQAEATNDLLHFVNNVMVEPSHSREQEDEADALGFDLSQMGPYAADTASARVFDTIQADETNRRAMTDALNAQLKNQLGRAVKDGSALRLMSGGMSGGSLKMGLLKGGARLALSAAGSAEGGPKHRSPEDRKKGIAAYSADAYPDGLPLREEQKAWLTQVRGTPEYAQAKATVVAVKSAMKHRAAGEYPAAEQQIAIASGTVYGDSPLVLNEAARIRDDMGDTPRADELFRAAHKSRDQTVDGYVDHVRMLYRKKQDAKAMQVVDDGTRRFNNDDKPFISLLIAISKQDGRQDAAQSYYKRCVSFGDDALKKDCDLAAGDLADGESAKSAGPKLGIPSLGGLGGLGGIRRPF